MRLKNDASTDTRFTSRWTARGRRKTSFPNTSAEPPSCRSSVESRRTSVDFPEPFWPRMATHSPRVSENVTPCRAATRRAAPAMAQAAVAVTADELLAQVADFDSRLGGHDDSMPRRAPGGAREGAGREERRLGRGRRASAPERSRQPAQQATLSRRHAGLKSSAAAYDATRCWRSSRSSPSRACGWRTSRSRSTA